MTYRPPHEKQKHMSPEEVRIALGLPDPAEAKARSGGRWHKDEDGIYYMVPPGWTQSKMQVIRTSDRCMTCGRLGEETCTCTGKPGPCEWCPSGSRMSQG